MCVGDCSVDVVPSPNSQSQAIIGLWIDVDELMNSAEESSQKHEFSDEKFTCGSAGFMNVVKVATHPEKEVRVQVI